MSRSRKKKRTCSGCGAEFVEFPASGCLIYPIILLIAFGSLFLGAFVPFVIVDYGARPYIIFIIFILAFIIPGYFFSATVPLRLSRHRGNEGKELGFKDEAYRFPVVLIILILVAVLATRNCSESFFPKDLRELARTREDQVWEFRQVLLAYKEDHGCYPEDLHELIPDYTDTIPREIDPDTKWQSRLYAIRYYSGNCKASFGWRRCNGPDCGSEYHVDEDEIWHDM